MNIIATAGCKFNKNNDSNELPSQSYLHEERKAYIFQFFKLLGYTEDPIVVGRNAPTHYTRRRDPVNAWNELHTVIPSFSEYFNSSLWFLRQTNLCVRRYGGLRTD